ncbi:MAG: SIMPL domain-containing protein [Ignavibacteriae bacterium]|nr:SIMPL domain-containing protein [Ignavibacteriota bacterium]
MRDNHFVIPSIVLALGIVLGIGVFSWSWRDARSADQTITVTGSAKKDIVSDLGILRGSVAVESPTAAAAYQELKSQMPVLLEYLSAQGFPEDQVEKYPITNYPVYNYNTDGAQTGIKGYVYSQKVEITSKDVNKIRVLALDIPSVIEKGVFFTADPPEYHYTKLANLKVQIQAEAAKDAMIRADRIAESTGSDLGPMRSARMGVLQITPKNSNQVSDYGVNDVSSIEKEITAVVNASFQIK